MPTIKPKPSAKPARHLDVTRPDQLHALGDATRWRILGRLLDGPASVQELARALGVAKGTVGHHVRVLDVAGLVRVVEEQRVRGVVEKRYARVARQYRLREGEASSPATRDARFSHLPLRQALGEARAERGSEDPSTSIVVRARMPAARARRFARLVEQLAAEFAEGAPGEGEAFGFVAAVYVPDWGAADAPEDAA
jgi:DNA-binding transcriptional ArsR family regulator